MALNRASGVLTFRTAWSAPRPVIDELARRLAAPLTHEWADEDVGRNAGRVEYAPGRPAVESLLDGSVAGYELAFALGVGDRRDYRLVDGRYEADEAAAEAREPEAAAERDSS